MAKIDIAGELNPATTERVLADAKVIKDRTQDKNQETINNETKEKLGTHDDEIASLQSADTTLDKKIDDVKELLDNINNNSYKLPTASNDTLGGIKTGIYFTVNNEGIIIPGEYYGRWPGDRFSDCNKVVSPGYYHTDSKPSNGPNGDDFPSSFYGAIHCLFIKQMSGSYYIQQILFVYNHDAFYTRWCRVVEDSDTISSSGSWQKISSNQNSGGASETASYGKLGSVQGYSGDGVLSDKRYGINFSSTGEISVHPSSIRLPMSIYTNIEDMTADVQTGLLCNDNGTFKICTQGSNGGGASGATWDELDLQQMTNVLMTSQNYTSFQLMYNNGSSVKPMYIVNKGSNSNRPLLTSFDTGVCYYDTDINAPVWWDGTEWRMAASNATPSADGLMSKEDKAKVDAALTGDGVASVKVVTRLPEEPDDNTVYIIRG